jgi:RHS repeat-associated protein
MPYGEPRGVQPPWNNDKVFVGGTADPTALPHLGAREYDATMGRFISVDAVRDLQSPQQWHGYAYAGNNPTTSSDPSGLYFVEGNNGEGQHTIANGGGSAGAAMVAGKLRGSPLSARIDNSTLGSEIPNPRTVGQQVNIDVGRAGKTDTHFEDLDPVKQRNVLAEVWCMNNPAACKKYLDDQEHAQLSAIGSFLWELTGIPDAIDCVHGSVSGCVWTIVGFVPFGKLKDVAKGVGAGADLSR